MKFQDITGQKFNRWTVLKKSDRKDKRGKWLWECRCECGTIGLVTANSLKTGNSKSCGCWKKEQTSTTKTTHGKSQTRLYKIWLGMKKRCNNPKSSIYKHYGGRGITVCGEWSSFEPFYEWSMGNGYEDTLTIDRIDVNGNYEPSNCRWVTAQQQHYNTRKSHFITFEGKTLTMKEWAEEKNVPYVAFKNRLYKGWDVDKALSTPCAKRKCGGADA